ADRGRLAGAVRAEEPEALAGRDREAHVAHDLAARVALAEAAGLDDGTVPGHLSGTRSGPPVRRIAARVARPCAHARPPGHEPRRALVRIHPAPGRDLDEGDPGEVGARETVAEEERTGARGGALVESLQLGPERGARRRHLV